MRRRYTQLSRRVCVRCVSSVSLVFLPTTGSSVFVVLSLTLVTPEPPRHYCRTPPTCPDTEQVLPWSILCVSGTKEHSRRQRYDTLQFVTLPGREEEGDRTSTTCSGKITVPFGR